MIIYTLEDVCGTELRAKIDCHFEDGSFDYEYGSEKGTHVVVDVEIDEVIIEAKKFDYRSSTWIWEEIHAEGIADIICDNVDRGWLEEELKKELA